MSGRHDPRVLTIPQGVPFLRTLAGTLCDGRLSPSFVFDPGDPLSLSRVTIYVPTRRAARVLRSEFVDITGGRSTILPVIRPLGETDDDSGYFDEALPSGVDLAEPISGTARLLELARLIVAWRNRLPQAIEEIHSGSPLVAPASPADAIWLARDLAELIDAIETEERDWSDIGRLGGDYALWWQLTAEFLKIAGVFWPARLEELKRSSPARHRNAILKAEAVRLSGLTGHDPVIVAGSTGSIPAAADLIAAVANLPQGVIVLPGLDTDMSESDWRRLSPISEALGGVDPAIRAHPQYGLCRLLERLALTRADIEQLGTPDQALGARAEIVSRAMVPAEGTDGWNGWTPAGGAAAFQRAFADVSLIEAASEREEATAIAVALRLALEQAADSSDGASRETQAALITPDRALARRVAAELARFGIEADDTAGTPLSATPQGTLLQLVLEAVLRPGDPVALVSLLKHPLARFGMERDSFRTAATALELHALRGGVAEVDIADLPALVESRLGAKDSHPPRWRTDLPSASTNDARRLARAIADASEPLASALVRSRGARRGLSSSFSLSDWATRTAHVLEAVCRDERGDLAALWSGESGEALAALLKDIVTTDGQMEADGAQWIDIMAAFTTGEAVKPRAMSHPRVFIFGTLEARLQSVDTLILGGMNEGVWPDQASSNPFISRGMKTEIGLEPPERRTGQLAHDFEMANGTRRLIYSRALRQGSTPTVASRWLQRLIALGGEDFAAGLRERGACYRQWAAQLDEGLQQAPARRPDPRPPAAMQPSKYSFSEVGRLRRDPYSIYARRVLKLDPVDAFNSDPGASERGTLYHAIVHTFVSEGHVAGTPAGDTAMTAILHRLFDAQALPPHIDAVWRPRFEEVARAFLRWEANRRAEIKASYTEVGGSMALDAIGIRVTGIADRIDIRRTGEADIIDYKTGYNPTVSQARSLLDPQLALEAAALKAGGFTKTGPLEPSQLVYVRLRPGDRFRAEPVNNEAARSNPKSAHDLADASIDQLVKFITLLQSGERGFVSRLIPAKAQEYGGEYDHLARVSEWATAETEEQAEDE